MMLVNDMSAI